MRVGLENLVAFGVTSAGKQNLLDPESNLSDISKISETIMSFFSDEELLNHFARVRLPRTLQTWQRRRAGLGDLSQVCPSQWETSGIVLLALESWVEERVLPRLRERTSAPGASDQNQII